ncbi:MAG: FlgD immunoglobulin-like domain containing protein, partial [Bacteroidota bacterium]
LAKYDEAGNRLNAVTEPGISFTTFNCVGFSAGHGLAELGGFIYVAGHSGLKGLGEDGGVSTGLTRPVLMKYDSGLNRIWKARPSESAGFFRAVGSLTGDLYAVGNTYTSAGTGRSPNPIPGTADYLIEKYDTAGNRLWRIVSGGVNDDVLTGVVAIGSRLFAVGYTRSSGAGGAEAVILEVNPSTGAILSTTLFGGSQDDFANGAATDGSDLYVVGESRSFANAGNAIGQNDVMLLRYTLQITVSIDIKPGSDPNSINCNNEKEVIPVAILTTADFDATTVDHATVTFEGASETHVNKKSGKPRRHEEDVDGDGDTDLVFHFRLGGTDLTCESTEGTLTGETFDGQAIEGTDAIRMVEGGASKSVAVEDETVLPEGYALYQNHPNPFNPETEIRFYLPEANYVVIKIYNIRGEEIRTLANGPYISGDHKIRWDGKDNNVNPVSSGVYLYQLKAGSISQVKKMSLIR